MRIRRHGPPTHGIFAGAELGQANNELLGSLGRFDLQTLLSYQRLYSR